MVLKLIHIFCAVLIFIYNVQGFSREDPVVETNVGTIRGVRASNGNYTMFLGIPFARVNESFPFGDTLPVTQLDGVFEAYDDGVRCPSWHMGEITGSLDCLVVNLHVPDSAGPDNKLPVMIYIYGGRFVIGTAGRFLSGPEYLVQHDVIIASISYRLGPYGFMCLDIPEVPGNQGFRDQQNGINWVKDNIEAFGGDVNRMTLFGNSAGAMSVDLHLLSKTEKVFRNAILQSGPVLSPGMFSAADTDLPLRLAAQLGLETVDVYEALRFLATFPAHDIIALDLDPVYTLCVEKEFPGVEPFVTNYPLNLKYYNITGMRILQGITSEESLPAVTNDTFTENLFRAQLNNIYNFEGETLDEAADIMRRFYIGDENINQTVFWELVDFLSDLSMAFPATRTLPKYFEGGAEYVYQYVLSYEGTRNYGKISNNIQHLPGAAHADCLGYLFGLEYPGVPEPTAEDQLMIDRMTTLWTNFAKYNDPTPETTELIPVKWEPVTPGSPEYYLEINDPLALRSAYQHQRMNFWRLFTSKYAQYELGYDYENSSAASSFSPAPILIGIIVYLFI